MLDASKEKGTDVGAGVSKRYSTAPNMLRARGELLHQNIMKGAEITMPTKRPVLRMMVAGVSTATRQSAASG